MERTTIFLAALVTLAGCDAASDPELEWWRGERATRQAALDRYLADNADDLRSFENADMTAVGFPMVVFRLLPELFPEYWGTPEQRFGPVGFESEPGRVLPFGLSYAGADPLTVVGPTCSECHTGRVKGPDGAMIKLIGGASNRFDGSGLVRAASALTVTSPRFTSAAFRAALAAKPPGWVYGDPAMAETEARERALFDRPEVAEAILGAIKARVLDGVQRAKTTVGATTYRVPDPPPTMAQPGYMDLASYVGPAMVDPAAMSASDLAAAMPPLPAPADIMAAWMQRDRAAAKWDGLTLTPLYGNLAVALVSTGGEATNLNLDNAIRVTRLLADLPPPPYPFDVEAAKAARGEALWKSACASCHAPGNPEVYAPSRVGTDANRAQAWTPYIRREFVRRLRLACTDAVACAGPGGAPLSDEEIFRGTGGYMALPLHGIWATAPYLHNGSVPTLRQLLTGRRPAQFYRGSPDYDQEGVGFVWDRWTPGATLYDTRLSGLSNGGHDTPEFLGGIDWAAEPDKTDDLLEYMKTL